MSRGTSLEDLQHSIVRQAVDDWRALCKGQDIPGQTFDTIRSFFNSEWGELLCVGRNDYILSKLEEELEVENAKRCRI